MSLSIENAIKCSHLKYEYMNRKLLSKKSEKEDQNKDKIKSYYASTE
jgi:hypothetical protein